VTDASPIAAIICEGPCNGRYRRAEAAYKAALASYDQALLATLGSSKPPPPKPEKHDVVPYPGDPIWCLRDQGLIRVSLLELEELAVLVTRNAGEGLPGRAADTPRVSGTRGSRSPSPLANMVIQLESELRNWEFAIRGEDTKVRRGHLCLAITASVNWLYANFDFAICHPGLGKDFGCEIRAWHRRLMSVGHAGSARHTKRLPCPRPTCQRFGSLVEEEGNDYIECVACHNLMSRDEYDYYESIYPKLRRQDAVSALSA